jgi:hypothetical protein
MKISITIDIDPAEVFTLLEQIRNNTSVPEPEPPKPQVRVRVADDAKNRANDFWKARIGEEGVIIRTGSLAEECDVQFPNDPTPIYNVATDRFTLLDL